MCVYCICIRANTHAYRRLQKYGKSVGERMCFAVSGSEHAATHEESDCYQRQPPSLCARPFGRYSSLGRLGMAWPNLAISCNFAVAFTIFSYFFLSFFLTHWPMAPLGRLWLWDRDMARKIRKTDENWITNSAIIVRSCKMDSYICLGAMPIIFVPQGLQISPVIPWSFQIVLIYTMPGRWHVFERFRERQTVIRCTP